MGVVGELIFNCIGVLGEVDVVGELNCKMTNLYESTPLDLAMIALDARKPKIGQPSAPSRVAFGHPTSGKWCIVAIGIPMTS
ncbi:unnamed protein product [Prunus armeniaca]